MYETKFNMQEEIFLELQSDYESLEAENERLRNELVIQRQQKHQMQNNLTTLQAKLTNLQEQQEELMKKELVNTKKRMRSELEADLFNGDAELLLAPDSTSSSSSSSSPSAKIQKLEFDHDVSVKPSFSGLLSTAQHEVLTTSITVQHLQPSTPHALRSHAQTTQDLDHMPEFITPISKRSLSKTAAGAMGGTHGAAGQHAQVTQVSPSILLNARLNGHNSFSDEEIDPVDRPQPEHQYQDTHPNSPSLTQHSLVAGISTPQALQPLFDESVHVAPCPAADQVTQGSVVATEADSSSSDSSSDSSSSDADVDEATSTVTPAATPGVHVPPRVGPHRPAESSHALSDPTAQVDKEPINLVLHIASAARSKCYLTIEPQQTISLLKLQIADILGVVSSRQTLYRQDVMEVFSYPSSEEMSSREHEMDYDYDTEHDDSCAEVPVKWHKRELQDNMTVAECGLTNYMAIKLVKQSSFFFG